MAEKTGISWADATFNPWVGCTKVSPACDNCYAQTLVEGRFKTAEWGSGKPRVRTSEANWRQPLKWNREAGATGVRKRVFCASLADVFDNEVDPAWRADLLDLIVETPHLDWLLLTKRIGNAHQMLINASGSAARWTAPQNVWIGATVCTQAEADRDIPKLLAIPAAKRFLSIEPMLGPIDLSCWLDDGSNEFALSGSLDWVICGGESGKNARPMHPDWARSLRDQCAAAGAPFHFKQWGEWLHDSQQTGLAPSFFYDSDVHAWPDGTFSFRTGTKANGSLLDGVMHDGVPAIAELKAIQTMEAKQMRKIHPLDFPLEVFLSDMTTRPAKIIRAELAGFASYAGTGTFDIEPPFTVRHLCMFSRSEMRKWPGFGRKCLNEVEEMLRARGLQLWENHDERSLRLLREHEEYFKRQAKE